MTVGSSSAGGGGGLSLDALVQHSTQAEKDADRAFLKWPTFDSYVEHKFGKVVRDIWGHSYDSDHFKRRTEVMIQRCYNPSNELKKEYEKYVKGALSESSIEKKIITAQHAVRFFCCLCVAIDPY